MHSLQLTRPHLAAMLWLMSPSSGESSIDLSVDVAGVSLINPIMTASGTSGYGPEHAELMDFTGRPMKGMVFVGSEGLASDKELKAWVQRGVDFALSLPAK